MHPGRRLAVSAGNRESLSFTRSGRVLTGHRLVWLRNVEHVPFRVVEGPVAVPRARRVLPLDDLVVGPLDLAFEIRDRRIEIVDLEGERVEARRILRVDGRPTRRVLSH